MRTAILMLPLALSGATFLAVSPAHATEGFPPAIAGALSLDYRPDCGLCHAKGNTGSGTATTPFALAMKERGLEPENAVSLRQAIEDMARDGVDSDGDGATDVEELSAGTNPNSPAAEASIRSGEDPSYGCSIAPRRLGARGGPLGGLGGIATFGIAGGLALLLRRKRNPFRVEDPRSES